ncbi:MAG: hypothetical protein ACXWX0_05940 [Actinomycetota bacterium]
MTTPVESYRVLWGASEDPTSDAGRALFAATTFVFGADGTDRVELHAGDYVWIREGVMHEEETPEDEGVELIVAHLEPFETLES